MSISTILILSGLAVNFVASLFMLWPYLNTKRNVEDDFLENIDLETGDYTQTKHIKDKKLGLVGFSLFSIGFLLQFLGIMFEL